MRRINLYITDAQQERIDQRARQRGVTFSEEFRATLDAGLGPDGPTDDQVAEFAAKHNIAAQAARSILLDNRR